MNVIQIENLWKEYRLGVISHGTLSRDLQSWWARLRGKEDPNSKLQSILAGQEKQIEGDRFWALRDINLEVKEGEILGIIGRNGAGKSTLLKLLSRITAPTRGQIKIKGRVASLLEVGTGFHLELTGRENIFMNGAVLGMSKQEIRSKLDAIIAFSGIEEHLETPVKRYSSGMRVRLAFAVAAHLEPEILIIDEVLAVGDAEFQKKCIGKMGEVANEGRTVLFVSHNMIAIKSLCRSAIFIDNGKLSQAGNADEIVDSYNFSNQADSLVNKKEWLDCDDRPKGKYFEIEKIYIVSLESKKFHLLPVEHPIEIGMIINQFGSPGELDYTIVVKSDNHVVFATSTLDYDNLISREFIKGKCEYLCTIPNNFLNNRIYTVDILVLRNQRNVIGKFENILSFETIESRPRKIAWLGARAGFVAPKFFLWTARKASDLS
jgi:lipopolysaccharide transport system ATP-binding protein